MKQKTLKELNAFYGNLEKRWPKDARDFRYYLEQKHGYPYCVHCERFVDFIEDVSGDCKDCATQFNSLMDTYDMLTHWIDDRGGL